MLMSGARRATRARGGVVPRRRIQRVLNPLSGRRIQTTGALYRSLTAPLGPLVRNRYNRLDINYGNYLTVTHLIDPSEGTVGLRNSRIALVTHNQRAVVRAVVEGLEPYERRMRQIIADIWVPQLAEYIGRFEYGPREWLQVEEDNDGEWRRINPVARLLPREGVVRFLRSRGIRSDTPTKLPFINVDLNPGGTEGTCIQQFLTVPLMDPADTSVAGIIDTARCHQLSVRLMDLFGTTLAEHLADGNEMRAAIVYNKHVYPMTDGDLVPVLNYGDAPPLNSVPRIHEMLEQNDYMLWRQARTYYTPEGKVHLDRDDDASLYEDWMTELFNVTPPALGVDDVALETMRRGTIGLYYADAPPGTFLAAADHLAIDMSKCYYSVLVQMLENEDLPTLSMYDRWVEVPFAMQMIRQTVSFSDLVLIGTDLSRYGFRTNMICGKVYNMWHDNGWPMKTTAVLRMRKEEVSAQRAMLKVLRTYSTEQQKKYAIINGMFGKIKLDKELWLEVRDPDEQEYYHVTHDMSAAGPDVMTRLLTTPVANSRFQVYQAVVHMANATVFEWMLYVQRDLPLAGLPVKIKIDSLTYDRNRLRTPFDPSGKRAMQRFVETNQTVDWHFEEVRNDIPLINPMLYRELSMHTEYPDAMGDYSRNITFVGPPGVGKTYQALLLDCDVKTCFSNKGARRIGGITLDSALGMRPGLYTLNWDREKIKGKRVFVDEAQAMRPRHWGLLKFAYLHLGTSFVFSLDPDQIPPVEHEKYPVSEHPFWGDVRRLTVDHRNEPCLIQARESVLRQDFEPDVNDGAPMTMLNIAYTNRTCQLVNAWVARVNGLVWMGPGKYIVKVLHAKSGLCKGEIIYREHGRWVRWPGGEVIEGTFPDAGAKRYVKWAYCVTIHNTIGETFTDPYTIWDIGHPGFSTKLMYTALTRGISLRQITFRGRVVPTGDS
jgi:hypothetical protein